MQNAFAILEEFLKMKYNKKPFYYFPNPGNWGDGLIRHGTLKFLYDKKIDFKELKRSDAHLLFLLSKGSTIIYGGGGGWCKLWNHSVRYIHKFEKRFDVIVLPSTFESSYLTSNTTFFCRDMYESKKNMPNAFFCHDMAFYIGENYFQRNKGHGMGYFFRSDTESANRINIPPYNNDISLKGNQTSDISQFFNEINRFTTIYTDRLHVSIAACLLGKEVHLYPGSYFKNQAVYMSSMKDYFSNIFFHEKFDS